MKKALYGSIALAVLLSSAAYAEDNCSVQNLNECINGTDLTIDNGPVLDTDLPNVVAFLNQHPDIDSLHIGPAINLTDAGGVALAKTQFVKEMTVTQTQIGDATVSALALNPTLEYLDLEDNLIGDMGAKALAAYSHVSKLLINGNLIGDAGAAAFANDQYLNAVLDLTSNRIGDAGAIALASNAHITDLFLGGNHVGNDGAASLAKDVKLGTLHLEYNEIGDKGVSALAQNTNLIVLNLAGNEKITDAGIGAFGSNQSRLKELYIDYIDDVTDAGIVKLANNKHISWLSVIGAEVGDRGAAAIATMNVTDLNLDSNHIGNAGAIALSKLPNPTFVNLSIRYNVIGQEGIAALKAAHYAQLDVEGNNRAK